jgi:hypothetical protein
MWSGWFGEKHLWPFPVIKPQLNGRLNRIQAIVPTNLTDF